MFYYACLIIRAGHFRGVVKFCSLLRGGKEGKKVGCRKEGTLQREMRCVCVGERDCVGVRLMRGADDVVVLLMVMMKREYGDGIG